MQYCGIDSSCYAAFASAGNGWGKAVCRGAHGEFRFGISETELNGIIIRADARLMNNDSFIWECDFGTSFFEYACNWNKSQYRKSWYLCMSISKFRFSFSENRKWMTIDFLNLHNNSIENFHNADQTVCNLTIQWKPFICINISHSHMVSIKSTREYRIQRAYCVTSAQLNTEL